MINFDKLRESQSKELNSFYKYIKHNIEMLKMDAATVESFHPKFGLCGNIDRYSQEIGLFNIRSEMTDQFKEAELNTRFPFNKTDEDYVIERCNDSIYKNPERLQWIHELAK